MRDRAACAQPHIVAHVNSVKRKGRLIRQNVKGVVVYCKPVTQRLYRDTACFIAEHPMQRRQRKLLAEADIDQIDFFKKALRFIHAGALRQKPRNQLKRRNVILSLRKGIVDGVLGKCKPAMLSPFSFVAS